MQSKLKFVSISGTAAAVDDRAKAYLSGTRPDVEHDPEIHGKVAL